jgi:two-component system sensor histidine kinase/response regulator
MHAAGWCGSDRSPAGRRARLERLRLRRRARRGEAAARARAAFLATMSHEMREPLNAVLGMARLLQDTPLAPDQAAHVAAILEAGEALLTLVNDILDLSRIDAGKLELAPVDLELRPFLERVVGLLEPRARDKNLALELAVEPTVPELVRVDPARLRQVLLNLLGNAIKFTERGRIRLAVASQRQRDGEALLAFELEDSGIGIEAADLARLFRPWQQATVSTGRLYGGSGLGLVVARQIVEAMGGVLGCTSRPGEGTTFRLLLPVPVVERVPVARGPAPALAGAHLLIADPVERSRAQLRDLAILWGMTVRTAASGREALLLLREASDRGAPFELAILAERLTDPDPVGLAERLRAEPRLAGTRLVLLTPGGLRGDARRAEAAGFAAYLAEPVSAETLMACLRTLRAGAGSGILTRHNLSERRGGPLSVLVVDDNALNCRLLAILLERAGHRVVTVGSGEAALERLAAEPFDLVLMDMQMPGLDGLETTRRIRALPDPARAATPVVAVTADAMAGDEGRCRAAGMDGYLTKPVDGATLLATVERHARAAFQESVIAFSQP